MNKTNLQPSGRQLNMLCDTECRNAPLNLPTRDRSDGRGQVTTNDIVPTARQPLLAYTDPSENGPCKALLTS